ncbi:Uncharacterised protein [Mycoplasmopsis synoviae]|uniref:Uncharacterized protein n=2 Tax=Mycoplasmopsis synoviae TaxID=2109 RepID=A0A3B0P6M4_MYCSY|nr:Uncharacterised protein [Mycoplasmopsis synoviae]
MRNVNVYLNYTGPAIVLDATLPEVGALIIQPLMVLLQLQMKL